MSGLEEPGEVDREEPRRGLERRTLGRSGEEDPGKVPRGGPKGLQRRTLERSGEDLEEVWRGGPRICLDRRTLERSGEGDPGEV